MKEETLKLEGQPDNITIRTYGKNYYQAQWRPDNYRQIKPAIDSFIEELMWLKAHGFEYEGMSYDTGYYGEIDYQYLNFEVLKSKLIK